MFLVQATIESATAIGDGLSALGRQITAGEDAGSAPADSISATLRGIADSALEPYASRFSFCTETWPTGNDRRRYFGFVAANAACYPPLPLGLVICLSTRRRACQTRSRARS